MNRNNIIRMVFLFFYVTALQVHSDIPKTGSSLIYQVRTAIDHIKPFKVTFTQQVFDEDQLEIEESGEIIFKDQKTLKWTYLDPDYKVFLLMGDDYKFYDRDNEQLTIGKVKDKNRQWLWQLLFSREMAEYIKPDRQNKKIYIKNETDNLDIEIEINGEFLPVKAVQKDPSGVILIYRFNNYIKNMEISGKTFKLEVPDGVDVVTE